jgi:hypothetical protein
MCRDYELIHFGKPWKLQPVFHGCKVIPLQFANFCGSAQRWIFSQQWAEAWFAGEGPMVFFNPHMAGEPCACHRAIQGFGSQPCYHLSPPFTTVFAMNIWTLAIWIPKIWLRQNGHSTRTSLKWLQVPSGKQTKSYWKWPFIVSFPIKNCDFP